MLQKTLSSVGTLEPLKKRDSLLFLRNQELPQETGVGDAAQLYIECLSNMHKALDSIPSMGV